MAKLRVKDIAYRHTEDIDLTRVAQSKEWDKLAIIQRLTLASGTRFGVDDMTVPNRGHLDGKAT